MKSSRYAIIVPVALLLFSACGEKKAENTSENNEERPKDTIVIKANETEAEPLDSAAKMKAMMDYMTPGPMHEMMTKQNGSWVGDIKMWMDPNGEPMSNTGATVNKMILGGRYQESTHTGNWGGMPFEAKALLSYDNISKKFKSIWIDNFGTGTLITEGPYDEATKTANLTGEMMNPETGKNCKVREVMQFTDDNSYYFEMYMEKDGKETKTMEIRYTRKK